MVDTYIGYILLFLILITGFLLRVVYINFPIDDDFGFYTYLPHFYKRGVRVINNFRIFFPFTLVSFNSFVYGKLGNDPRNLRLALALYNVLNAVALFSVSKYLFGTQTALLAVLIYSFYSSSPHLGTYSCNNEGLYILPVTLAIYAFSIGLIEAKPLYFFYSGLLFSCAFLIKIVNVVFFVLFLFFTVEQGELGSSFNFAGAFVLGLSLYLIFITNNFWGKNHLCWSQSTTRFKIAFRNMEKKLKRLLERSFVEAKPIFFETSFIWVLSSLFFINTVINERNQPETILLLWAVSTVIILFSQRAFWMYHYIPIVHLFSILSAAALFKLLLTANLSPFNFSALALFVLLFFLFNDIYRKVRLLYLYKTDGRSIDFVKGDQYFLAPVIAEYIKKNSTPENYIFVWGSFDHIYILADRRSSESFLFHYMKPYDTIHGRLFDDIIGGVISKRPKFIIMSRPDFDINVLEQITGLEYELRRVFFNRYRVYKFKRKINNPLEIDTLSWKRKKELMEKLSPGPMDARIDEYYFEKKMYEKAMEEFVQAKALYPHDIITNMGIAQLLRKNFDYEEALKNYKEVLKKGKYKGWVYQEIALTNNEMGNYNEAINYFKKAISNGCSKEWAYLGIGTAYREMSNFGKAFENFDKAGSLNSEMTCIYREKGITYTKLGKYKEAFIELEKALRIDPSMEWVHFNMGVTFKKLGELNNALSEFEAEQQLNPKNLLAKYNQMSTIKEINKNNRDRAEKGFLEIVTDNPSLYVKSGSYFHLGEINFTEGNYLKAKEFFLECLKLVPSHKKASEYLKAIETNRNLCAASPRTK